MDGNEKGKRGEREWAKFLRDKLGLTNARRGQQYSGSPDSPDVVEGIPGTHCEVKRVERLNIAQAMTQATDDAGDSIPYVAHRKNGQRWLVTLWADDLQGIADLIADPKPRADPFATLPMKERYG